MKTAILFLSLLFISPMNKGITETGFNLSVRNVQHYLGEPKKMLIDSLTNTKFKLLTYEEAYYEMKGVVVGKEEFKMFKFSSFAGNSYITAYLTSPDNENVLMISWNCNADLVNSYKNELRDLGFEQIKDLSNREDSEDNSINLLFKNSKSGVEALINVDSKDRQMHVVVSKR